MTDSHYPFFSIQCTKSVIHQNIYIFRLFFYTDICGVCGGDGVSCRTTRGSFNESKYGYNTIIRIPAGASNLDIRQRSHDDTARDDNYLALLDNNEEYILNGHFVVSMFRKTLHYSGSILEYSGSDEVVERINSSSRPIKSDLVLQVLSVGKLNPPDIMYQYVISLNYNSESRGGVGGGRSSSNLEEARWTHSDRWTSCSEICAGSQTQIQICTNSRTGSEISSEYCRLLVHHTDLTKRLLLKYYFLNKLFSEILDNHKKYDDSVTVIVH